LETPVPIPNTEVKLPMLVVVVPIRRQAIKLSSLISL